MRQSQLLPEAGVGGNAVPLCPALPDGRGLRGSVSVREAAWWRHSLGTGSQVWLVLGVPAPRQAQDRSLRRSPGASPVHGRLGAA